MAPSPSAFRNIHKSPSSWREFWLQINSFVSALPLNFDCVQMSHWAYRAGMCLGTQHILAFWPYIFLMHIFANSRVESTSQLVWPMKISQMIFFFLSKSLWFSPLQAGATASGRTSPQRILGGHKIRDAPNQAQGDTWWGEVWIQK